MFSIPGQVVFSIFGEVSALTKMYVFVICIMILTCFTNVQVIGPLMAGEQFIQEDFDLLDKYTDKSTSGKVEAKINQFNIEDTR